MARPMCLMVAVVLFVTAASAQEVEKVQPIETVRPPGVTRRPLIAVPRDVAREFKLSARDLVTFRDAQWSALTLAQIAAAGADAVTSVNSLNRCSACAETGPSRLVVGEHPDAHKYILAGIVEVGAEAVTAHYFRGRNPREKWYWRWLWTLPQSVSLYEHSRAAQHNTNVD